MKINNLESALNCSSLPSGIVGIGGGVISPYNRDGVLNLPHKQMFAWCKTLKQASNRPRACI